MHRRTLPDFPDLRSFMAHLEASGDVHRIRVPVSMRLEATELHRRVIAAGGPVLRFDAPTVGGGGKSNLPVVANLFGTRRRVAAGLGTDAEYGLDRLGRLLAWMRSPEPPGSIRHARSMFPALRAALAIRPKLVGNEYNRRTAPPDLSLLPVQHCWPGDAGPLLTWPVVITRPPGPDDPAAYNLGVYRMQVIAKDRAIIRWLPMRGGAEHYRLWSAINEPMPVAVAIGIDPATMLSAVMPAPAAVSELTLAGMISGRRPRLSSCATVSIHAPSNAEILLEGTVYPGDTAMEGPFGDHTGYYNAPEPFPVFRLSAIRMRDDACYVTTFTGRAPDEPSVLAEALTDVFKPLLRQALPDILDIWLPPETCSYRVAVLSIAKRYPGQARRVMMGFWSLLPQFSMTKMLIVVDDDIDIRSWSDVMWAVATRADPSRDLVTVDRTPIDHLDFASPIEGLGGKLGIDATRKVGAETSRGWGRAISMDAEVQDRISRGWDGYFPKVGEREAAGS